MNSKDSFDTLEKKLDTLVEQLKKIGKLDEPDGHGHTALFYGKILH